MKNSQQFAPRYVPYYRVSTQHQGQSGLGLEGQVREINAYVQLRPGQLLESFTEIESGRKSKRPQIAKAIAYAKEQNAILLIAKLDRLARNVHFVSSLMESKVNFKAVDMPEADNFTIHVIAAVAERYAEDISKKTKSGLGSKKERIAQGDYYNARRSADGSLVKMKPDKKGVYRLGNPNGYTDEMRQAAKDVLRKKKEINTFTRMAKERIRECLSIDPDLTLEELAGKLNQYNIRTPSGKAFTRFNVAYLKRSMLA